MVRRRTSAFRQRHAGLRGEPLGANPPGFTLIELLVVIAIIALLMAILFPVLSRVRKQVRAMVCQAKLRQWGTVLPLYAQDNEGRFPCNVDGSAGAWLLRAAQRQQQGPELAPGLILPFSHEGYRLLPHGP